MSLLDSWRSSSSFVLFLLASSKQHTPSALRPTGRLSFEPYLMFACLRRRLSPLFVTNYSRFTSYQQVPPSTTPCSFPIPHLITPSDVSFLPSSQVRMQSSLAHFYVDPRTGQTSEIVVYHQSIIIFRARVCRTFRNFSSRKFRNASKTRSFLGLFIRVVAFFSQQFFLPRATLTYDS